MKGVLNSAWEDLKGSEAKVHFISFQLCCLVLLKYTIGLSWSCKGLEVTTEIVQQYTNPFLFFPFGPLLMISQCNLHVDFGTLYCKWGGKQEGNLIFRYFQMGLDRFRISMSWQQIGNPLLFSACLMYLQTVSYRFRFRVFVVQMFHILAGNAPPFWLILVVNSEFRYIQVYSVLFTHFHCRFWLGIKCGNTPGGAAL